MNRTGKRRLLKLADMLEADAKNKKGIKFNLNTVAEPSDRQKSAKETSFDPTVSCGTTACAMGLAAISGAFKRAGLSYDVDSWERYFDNKWVHTIQTTIDGQIVDYDDAAVAIFGITLEEANFLFTPRCYGRLPKTGAKGERIVAKRIRDFVAGKVKAPVW